MSVATSRQLRVRRHRRIRGKIAGTADRPRLAVFRSNAGISAQLIDDQAGKTLAAASWQGLGKLKGSKTDQAKEVGKLLAANAKKAGVETCVFDRGGYLYHGRVQALAEGAREGGLTF
ncbi:MAG TPA: 50S ribosomal protein L18 [Methylomirabilota bacterium]|jgi:large subunit ribosomal protein L18